MNIKSAVYMNEMLNTFNASTRGIEDRTASVKAEMLASLAFLRAHDYPEPSVKVTLVEGQGVPTRWPNAAAAAHVESLGLAYPTVTAYIAVLSAYLELDYI